MSVSLPNGALIAFSSGFDTADTVSAVTNANPGVATSTAHGNANGTLLWVRSGWGRLNDRAARVSGTAANSFNLEGINTTSTLLYPAGSGVGSVQAVTGWTALSQILSSSSNGGEQQYTEYQFLEDDIQKRLPTVKTASGLTLQIADDSTLPGYQLCETANDDRLPRMMRITLPSGAFIYGLTRISLNKVPTLTVNEVMAVTVNLSFEAELTRYSS